MLFSYKFKKSYFDKDIASCTNIELNAFKLIMLTISLCFIAFALYSVCNNIFTELNKEITSQISKSSRLYMFGNKETLSNNVKQINVNIQDVDGSSNELLSSSKLSNSAFQENSNTQNGQPNNISIQKNVNNQHAASQGPNNQSQITLISSHPSGPGGRLPEDTNVPPIPQEENLQSPTPLNITFTSIKNMFHSNVSSNSVSTSGYIVDFKTAQQVFNPIKFDIKVKSLLDQLLALPNHESAVNSFNKILAGTDVTDMKSCNAVLSNLT